MNRVTGTWRLCSSRPRPNLLSRSRCSPKVLFVERVIEPSDHHLVPGLIAPFDVLSWVWVEFVVCRIVVMCNALQFAAFRRGQRLFQPVVQLPVEIVFRNFQNDL